MSLRKRTKEIKRLIKAFEAEASKFHDLRFATFLVGREEPVEERKFAMPNHSVMLWQYYGNSEKTQHLLSDLKDSDLQWGIRGAEISCFGILEGESCELFCRMAKRAGNLFSGKELLKIKTYALREIVESEENKWKGSLSVINDNSLAIWLNYLLYYISRINPGREKASYIDPDPYSLSLMALEQIVDQKDISKIDKSLSKIEDLQFKVALSFPGERRKYVTKISTYLTEALGKDRVFYDLDYQSQLARPNLDSLLQDIYRYRSDLLVVFLCEEYSNSQWCGLEWRAIRDIIKSKEDYKVMFVSFGTPSIEGVFSIDGYIDALKYNERTVSGFILERVALLDTNRA